MEEVEEIGSSSASSSPKRARERDVVVGGEGDDSVVVPASKKLCIEVEAAEDLPAIANVLELEDLELRAADDDDEEEHNSSSCSVRESSCVLNSSSDEAGAAAAAEGGVRIADDLLAEHVVHSLFRDDDDDEEQEQQLAAASECSTLDKEDAARALRSLEEELGVSSESSSDDYASSSLSSLPSSTAQEALVDAALSSWGEEIWSNVSMGPDDGAGSQRVLEDLGAVLGSFESAQVDIGFLNEASDDELGIPPSPNSERLLDHDDDDGKEISTSSSSAAVLDDGENRLHDAVSWALQETTTPAVEPSAAGLDVVIPAEADDPDWLMPVGSLDFLLDFSSGYVPVAT